MNTSKQRKAQKKSAGADGQSGAGVIEWRNVAFK